MKTLPLIVLLALPAHAVTKRVVAVMYFDNNTAKEEYDPLRKGLADMIISDLAGAPNLTLVEREKLQKLVDEVDLQKTKFFDPSTALKMGKGMGATHAIAGSIAAVDPMMRLDIRLLEVATGKVVLTEQVKGNKDKFFELEEELVKKFLKGLQEADAGSTTSGAQNVASLVAYGKALDLSDQGDVKGASSALSKVVSTEPSFNLAKDRYQQMLKRLYGAAEKRETVLADAATTLAQHADAYLAGKDVATLKGYDDAHYLAYRVLRGALILRQLDTVLKERGGGGQRWNTPPMNAALQKKALPLMRAYADNQFLLYAEVMRWKKDGDGKRMGYVPTKLPREDEVLLRTLVASSSDADRLIACGACDERLPNELGKWIALGDQGLTHVRPTLAQLDPPYAKKALEAMDAHLAYFEGMEKKIDNWIADTLFAKGEVLLGLRRQEEAIAHWQQILDRFPTSHLFQRTEELIKMTLGVSEKQVALDTAVAQCAGVAGTIGNAMDEILKVADFSAVEKKLLPLEKTCAGKSFAGNNEQGSAWMMLANRAASVGECTMFAKAKANMLKVLPQMAAAVQPGSCATP